MTPADTDPQVAQAEPGTGSPAPSNKPPRHQHHWFRRLLEAVLALLLLVFSMLFILVKSEAAGNWLLRELPVWLPQLHIEKAQGNLANGFRVQSIVWDGGDWRLELDDIDAQWRLDCFWHSTFCVDHLRTSKILVWVAPDPQPKPFSGVHLPHILIPLRLDVGQLRTEQFLIQVGDHPIDFGLLDISGVVAGHDWALHKIHWRFDDALLGRGDLDVSGFLETHQHYPIRAQAQGQYSPPGVELPLQQVQLRVEGDFSELRGDLLAEGGDKGGDKGGAGKLHADTQLDLTQGNLPFRISAQGLEDIHWDQALLQQVQLELNGNLDAYRVKLQGSARWQQQPAVTVNLQASGSLQSLNIQHLQTEAAGASAQAQGKLAWQHGVQWQGDLQFSGLDPSRWVPQLPGRLSARSHLQVDWNPQQWSLQADDLQLNGELRQQPLHVQGKLAHSLDDHWQVAADKVTWGRNQLQLAGTLNQEWQLQGTLDLADLATLWPGLAGEVRGQWQVQGPRQNPLLKLQANSAQLGYADAQVEQVALQARLALLTLQDIHVDLQAEQGQIGAEPLSKIVLQADGQAEDHRLHLEAGYGNYRLTTSAQGRLQLSTLDWQGVLRGTTLSRDPLPLQPGHSVEPAASWLLAQTQPSRVHWSNKDGEWQSDPLCLADRQSSICLHSHFLRRTQQLDAGMQLKSFDLRRIDSLLQPYANLDAVLDADTQVQLRQGKLLQLSSRGSLNNVQLRRLGEQPLPVPLALRQMQWDGSFAGQRLQGSFSYRRSQQDQGSVSGSIDRLFDQPLLDLHLAVDHFALAQVSQLAHLDQQLQGLVSLDAQVKGQWQHPDVRGNLQLQDAALRSPQQDQPWFRNMQTQVQFNGTQASINMSLRAPQRLQWTPQSPALLSWNPGQPLQLAESCWRLRRLPPHQEAEDPGATATATDSQDSLPVVTGPQGGQLCADGQWQPHQQMQANLQLASELAPLLAPWLPSGLKLQGQTELQAHLHKAPQQSAQLQLALDVKDGYAELDKDGGGSLKLPFDNLHLHADLADRQVQGQLTLASAEIGQGSASFKLPQDAQAPLQAHWQLQSLPLALVRPFFPQISQLDGRVELTGDLQGSREHPHVNGQIKLADGRFSSPSIPVTLDEVNVTADVKDNAVQLQGSMKSGDGRATLTGTGELGQNWFAKLHLQGKDILVERRPDIHLIVQPDINLDVKLGEVFLGGNLEVSSGSLELKPLPDSAVEVSPDLVYIDQRKQHQIADRPWNFNMKLTLSLLDAVRLKGYGADVRMKGAVTLIRDQRRVLIGRGTVDVVEGKYQDYGQRLKVRSGQIIFNGPLLRPFINLEAVRETGTVTAGLRLTGPIDEPTVTLFSEPSLPDDEIMHYLLTGNPSSTGVGNQRSVANKALLSLSLYGGTPVAERVANRFGVEDFDISSSGDGDNTAVNVSGYLSPDLFLQYGVGVFTPVNTLTLRYRLHKNLFLEAVSGIENILDLLYSFEF